MARDPEQSRRIGAAMRSLRRRRSLSDAQVANLLGYGPNGRIDINRWERGERSISAERLWSYLEVVGATFADFGRELVPHQPTDRRLQEIADDLRRMAKGKQV